MKTMTHFAKLSLPVLSLLLAIALSGCGGGELKTEASYPTKVEGSDKILYSDQKRETIWGDGKTLGSKLFGKDQDEGAGSTGIGVNSFLWRASLDAVSFMPLSSADPFGGVILTDWYENPETPGERFKISIYILDKQLRADGVRASVFKQTKDKSGWRDVKTPEEMTRNIEDAILTRARELRVAQMGVK